MTLLVDTHAFLWFMTADARLSVAARRAMEDASAGWCLSAASVWEMAIKTSLGRLTLPAAVAEYVGDKIRAGLVVLPVEWTHAAAVETLPHHHGDPFDRLIIAQAQAEGLGLVTRDAIFRDYGVRVIW